jgi:hypothetical protein
MSLRFIVWVTGPAMVVMACTQKSGPEACEAAGGVCRIGGLAGTGICPNLGPQDCNPDRNPGGAVCCLPCPGGTVPAEGGSGCVDERRDAGPVLSHGSLAALQALRPGIELATFTTSGSPGAACYTDLRITEESAVSSQMAFDATLALPAFRSETDACPADSGVRYRVTFVGADSAVVATATLSPTGCRRVDVESAAGSAALRIEDDYYWLALGQAFGTPELRSYPATCGH